TSRFVDLPIRLIQETGAFRNKVDTLAFEVFGVTDCILHRCYRSATRCDAASNSIAEVWHTFRQLPLKGGDGFARTRQIRGSFCSASSFGQRRKCAAQVRSRSFESSNCDCL